ncbi:oligoendopeptidase F, partial [Vibrio tritonius]|nr:oligoendopeptidase F [Vibrio tritonius]
MNAPSWNLSVAYQGLDDGKIEQDITLISQCIDVLNQHVAERQSLKVMQNAIQTREAASTLLSTISTFASCHSSVDATHTRAKALSGRIAKLSSELAQAYTPYQDVLATADQSFIEQVLDHESGDVAGQGFL